MRETLNQRQGKERHQGRETRGPRDRERLRRRPRNKRLNRGPKQPEEARHWGADPSRAEPSAVQGHRARAGSSAGPGRPHSLDAPPRLLAQDGDGGAGEAAAAPAPAPAPARARAPEAAPPPAAPRLPGPLTPGAPSPGDGSGGAGRRRLRRPGPGPMALGDAGRGGGLIALTFCLLAARGKGGRRGRCRGRSGCDVSVRPRRGCAGLWGWRASRVRSEYRSVGRGLRVRVPVMRALGGLRAATGGFCGSYLSAGGVCPWFSESRVSE